MKTKQLPVLDIPDTVVRAPADGSFRYIFEPLIPARRTCSNFLKTTAKKNQKTSCAGTDFRCNFPPWEGLYFLAPESPGERRHSFFDNLSRLAGVSRAGSVGVPGKHLFCGCWGESLLAKSRAQPRDLCFESVICRVNVMNVVNVGERVEKCDVHRLSP